MFSLVALLASLPLVFAATEPTFVPAQQGPTVASTNYVGASNGTLPPPLIVPGGAFNRIIQIWLENTDYAVAASSNTFTTLATQGILLNSYYAVTHPSEPNYIASTGGSFWGLGADDYLNIPSNISTVVDLLEAKNISWASYQENMPWDGYQGYNYTSVNYVNTSAPPYTYYVRKHNPLIIYDSVANIPARANLIRNFNDFAADVNASVIPQWVFVTPNLVDDAHDTDIDYTSAWLEFWLVPLLSNPNFNDNGTLILLTFDETETYTVNNQVYTLLLGGAIPTSLHGTTDSTYYTHYSILSTVENNWKLGSLGRGDTSGTMSNVFALVANKTGYVNQNITGTAIPLTNLTGNIPGPLNAEYYIPFTAPNITAVGAGGGPVFVAPSLNISFTAAVAPPVQNLTALGLNYPSAGGENSTTTASTSSPTTTTTGGAFKVGVDARSVVGVLGALCAVFMIVA